MRTIPGRLLVIAELSDKWCWGNESDRHNCNSIEPTEIPPTPLRDRTFCSVQWVIDFWNQLILVVTIQGKWYWTLFIWLERWRRRPLSSWSFQKKIIRGSYARLGDFGQDPEVIYVAKNKSPLDWSWEGYKYGSPDAMLWFVKPTNAWKFMTKSW